MKYHITYRVEAHPEGIEPPPQNGEVGACTAILIGSLLYPPDGSYSALFMSRDGRTGSDLSDAELWKAWLMLAKQLSNSETLSENKRELCEQVFEIVTSALRGEKP